MQTRSTAGDVDCQGKFMYSVDIQGQDHEDRERPVDKQRH